MIFVRPVSVLCFAQRCAHIVQIVDDNDDDERVDEFATDVAARRAAAADGDATHDADTRHDRIEERLD
jgi:hypothetical protein